VDNFRSSWQYDVQTQGVEHLKAIRQAMESIQAAQGKQPGHNDRTRTSFDQATSSIKSHIGTVVAAAAAYVSLRAATQAAEAAVRRSVTTFAQFETYETQFVTLTGSTKAAREEMGRLFKFAAETPFELPEVVNAEKIRRALGLEGDDLLRTAGDAAAAMGKPIQDAVLAISQARYGEMERLKEFGISTAAITAQLGHKINRETISGQQEVADAVLAIFEDRYAGGMERLAQTTAGLWSTTKDYVNQMFLQIGESGIGNIVREDLKSIVEALQDAQKPGGPVSQFGKTFTDIFIEIDALAWTTADSIANAFSTGKIAEFFSKLDDYAKIFGFGTGAGAVVGGALGGPGGAMLGARVGGAGALAATKIPAAPTMTTPFSPAWIMQLFASNARYNAEHSGTGGPGQPIVPAGTTYGPQPFEELSFSERLDFYRRRARERAAIGAPEYEGLSTGGATARGAGAGAGRDLAAQGAWTMPPVNPYFVSGFEMGPMTEMEAKVAEMRKQLEEFPSLMGPDTFEETFTAQELIREGWRQTADDFETTWAEAFGRHEGDWVKMSATSRAMMGATQEFFTSTQMRMGQAAELFFTKRMKLEKAGGVLVEAIMRDTLAVFIDGFRKEMELRSGAALAKFIENPWAAHYAVAAAKYAALAGIAGGAAAAVRSESEERMRGLEKEDPWTPAATADDRSGGSRGGSAGSYRYGSGALTPQNLTFVVTYQHYGNAFFGPDGPDALVRELAPAINRALETGLIGQPTP